MKHWINDEDTLDVQDSELTFDAVYSKEYIPTECLGELKKADILLIPEEMFRERRGCFFPECTEEFFTYVKDNKSDNVVVDICVSDEDFQRIELHADLITVATLIVQWVILPTATSLIAAYLYDKIKNRNKSAENTNAEVNIIVEKDKKSKKISYSGSIENFEMAMKTIDETIFK
ncbi:hypothetical protein [Sinanaerobacter chloroacetimidivorans]|uniref:Uncharacterized protein n=1 Tax=Sinanaerobacter chloroacetimidivorans TaxID=2818044 RepID=A0A8J7VYL6_9FIRM|nr:hypothetical protein [Sinanaerobacter chloroacetimidivorans]MBR0596428.1 hypothetical protein [Sinanaerobacter chloroacetimidivorans]